MIKITGNRKPANLDKTLSTTLKEVERSTLKVFDGKAPKLPEPLTQDVFQMRKVTAFEIPLQNFKAMCLSHSKNTSRENLANLKSNFSILRNEAKNENYIDIFCEELGAFAIDLMKMKQKSYRQLGQIFSGELIKTQTQNKNYDEVIKLATASALSHSQKKDYIHVLGRLHSVQEACIATGRKKEAYNIQKLAYKYADEVIDNYDDAVKNFQSISSEPKPKECFYKEKAHIATDLAIMTAHKNRDLAVKYLKEAIAIYKEHGLDDEARFATKQLKRLKTSPMKNKLREVSGEELKNTIDIKIRRAVKSKPMKLKGAMSYKKVKDETLDKFFGREPQKKPRKEKQC